MRKKGGLDLVKTALQCESPKSLFITSCNHIQWHSNTVQYFLYELSENELPISYNVKTLGVTGG